MAPVPEVHPRLTRWFRAVLFAQARPGLMWSSAFSRIAALPLVKVPIGPLLFQSCTVCSGACLLSQHFEAR